MAEEKDEKDESPRRRSRGCERCGEPCGGERVCATCLAKEAAEQG